MKINQKKGRGLGLCSGGLDSILSGLVLREQGLHVEWITFETPFYHSKYYQAVSHDAEGA